MIQSGEEIGQFQASLASPHLPLGTHGRNLPTDPTRHDFAVGNTLKNRYFFSSTRLARNVPFLPGRRAVGSPPGRENRAR